MAVTAACQRFIDEVLKPRILPVIRPTQFNYPIDIHGKWRGTRYRFIQRYRSGFPDTLTARFESYGAGSRLRLGGARRWSMRRIAARVTITLETSGSVS